ncbi:MAG: hypothetical protein NT015_01140 [Alphaproteobacteria bacterium]|nr:hypothetical protein [Alphaproteobacteria bacterium]
MASYFATSTKQSNARAVAQQFRSESALALAVVRRDAGAARLMMTSPGASHVFTDLCLALSEAPIGDEPRCIELAAFGRLIFHKHASDDALIVFSLTPKRDGASSASDKT